MAGDRIGQDIAARASDARACRVALVRGEERQRIVAQALDAVIDEVDWHDKRNVVVKPNLVSGHVPLAATHRDSLAATLAAIRRRYGGQLTVAEGSAGCATDVAFENRGYVDVAERFGARLVDLNADEAIDARVYDRRTRPLRLRLARTLVESDCRVSLCVPKTHDAVVVTLSIKNLVMGGLVRRGRRSRAARLRSRGWREWLIDRLTFSRLACATLGAGRMGLLGHGNGHGSDKVAMHQGYAMLNLNIAKLAPVVWPHVSIVDGFEGMEGAGPVSGEPVPWRTALAGTDALAVDSLTSELMGYQPDEVGYLSYCAQLNLGRLYPRGVEVVGTIGPDEARRCFAPHPTYERQRNWHIEGAADLLTQGAGETPGG